MSALMLAISVFAMLHLGTAHATGPVTISALPATASVNNSAAVVVMLSDASTTSITVNYTTVDGQGTAKNNYTAQSGILNFAPGETVKTVGVPITGTDPPSPYTFGFQISNPTGGATISNATTTVTVAPASTTYASFYVLSNYHGIRPGTAYVTVVWNNAPTGNTGSVGYATQNVTAGSRQDYTGQSGTLNFPAGATSEEVAVPILASTSAGAPTFNFTISQAMGGAILSSTGTASVIIDAPDFSASLPTTITAVRGQTLAIPVTLTSPAPQASSIHIGIKDGTALAGQDYTSISAAFVGINAGQSVGYINIPILDNPNQYGSTTFTVSLTAANGNMVLGNSSVTVTIPAVSTQIGAVYSSAQTAAQSFLRFTNTGSTGGTVTIALADYQSGKQLGQWTTQQIPGAELQFTISQIETGAGITTKSAYYTVNVQPAIQGYLQHVLWRPADGTLTNLSTCQAGVVNDPMRISGVHTSTLGQIGFPGSVGITNTTQSSEVVILDIYDALTGTLLGKYTTAQIAGLGQLIVPVSAIETAAQVTPKATQYHYVIVAETGFVGYLQNLVNNQQAAVVSDMTTFCALDVARNPEISGQTLISGSVFSSSQSTSQSFLRFFNTGTSSGSASVYLTDPTTGKSLGQWSSTAIAPLSEQQFAIADIERAVGITSPPAMYSVIVHSAFTGYFQNVVWNPLNGTLTNLSTCSQGVTANSGLLSGVHTSLLGSNFPSTLVVNNTSSSSEQAVLSIFDAKSGNQLGTYTSPAIQPNGQFLEPITDLEKVAGITPGAGMYHYVVKASSAFAGFMQNLVDNVQVGVTTDMSTVCTLTGS